MYRTALLMLALCIALQSPAAAEVSPAVALERSLQELCGDVEAWPGYDPLSVPLAVFDGTNTFLFRHPAPPEEFRASGDLWVFEGRHPSIVANSSVSIGEVSTATVMLETLPAESTPEERAALVAHEGFHVFQGTTGRRWGANEVDLFTYPTDDAALLALRRMETEALRRAFAAREPEGAREWAAYALGLRDERFAALEEAHKAYERGIETMEGTATYVEYRIAGRTQPSWPEGGFDAEDVRSRAYTTGVAWALILDRFSPDWCGGFADDDSIHLDTALARALRDAGEARQARAFTTAEIEAMELAAHADVSRVLEQRTERRSQFESVPGWSVVVEADSASPLWPQGFDPLNVHRVEGGVLHSRFLRLGNDSGSAEVMDTASLTEGMGPHPLFNGILSLTLTGLENEPAVEVSAGEVAVSASGFSAAFRDATVERQGENIVIRIAPPERSDDDS